MKSARLFLIGVLALGASGAAMASGMMSGFTGALAAISKAMTGKAHDPSEVIGTMVDFAGGHPTSEESHPVIEALQAELGGDGIDHPTRDRRGELAH